MCVRVFAFVPGFLCLFLVAGPGRVRRLSLCFLFGLAVCAWCFRFVLAFLCVRVRVFVFGVRWLFCSGSLAWLGSRLGTRHLN